MDAVDDAADETVPWRYKNPQCPVIAKQTGKRCKRACAPGKKVCYMHGGASLSGIAHPAYKGRGFQMDLSIERGKALQSILEHDTELINLREQIALLRLRTSDLLKREASGECGSLWDDLLALHADATHEGRAITPEEIRPIIEAGRKNEQTWIEVRQLIQETAKVVGTEGKRRNDMGEVATKDEVRSLVVAIVNIVKDHVTDPAQLAAISRDLSRVLAGPKQPQAETRVIDVTPTPEKPADNPAG